MTKYYVIATVWSDEREQQIKVVAGEFDRLINARMFRDAYNQHYHTDAEIKVEFE